MKNNQLSISERNPLRNWVNRSAEEISLFCQRQRTLLGAKCCTAPRMQYTSNFQLKLQNKKEARALKFRLT